ncbi:alpha/beta fold hydrolase [Shewanella sp. SR44-3]|uniref:alpha/beta fold hydrolase n=2 Tax=unclassified Shewanella TaxID=196818 RepID=UPI0015FB70F3|nr:alpha/beta fold hydrolase [Shewanella sp. SR44-3]MBB1268365.1 alpha/beta fold hydrolase [Shewanella sp. SR44-3]
MIKSTQGYSSELNTNAAHLTQFWAQVQHESLSLISGINLAYGFIKHEDNRRAIVISNGRVESYLKYQELIYDCYQQGFSVYAIDHRGQGLSSRLTSNPHQGHVEKFSDYVDDLDLFINRVVQPELHNELFIIAHSMGAAIATHYIHQHPGIFTAAVFSAPMYGIMLPLPTAIIKRLANKLNKTTPIIDSNLVTANYVISGKDYQAISFKLNQLTHSSVRYQQYRDLYQQQSQCQLGSPTNQWLSEAIDAAKASISMARESQIPILILQASKDKIVCNRAQNQAISGLCQRIVIKGAYHEVFIEIDKLRDQALTSMFSFINQHSKIIST